MKILAIDTSAKAASAAIASEDKLIGEFSINTALTHSQTLIPMIDVLLKNTNTAMSEITALAVNAGPGSFTGVRIGVAAVKGLAFANNIPCVSVSTLKSMAYNMLGNDCVVCAVMDARCAQVYNALFRIKNDKIERLTDDRALALSDLKYELEKLDEKTVIVGDGAELTYEYLKENSVDAKLAPFTRRIQTASSTAFAAIDEIKLSNTVSAEQLMPVYLRLPQAQRELNKKLGVN